MISLFFGIASASAFIFIVDVDGLLKKAVIFGSLLFFPHCLLSVYALHFLTEFSDSFLLKLQVLR